MNATIPTALAVALTMTPMPGAHADADRRLSETARALSRIMHATERRIPAALLERAHCIAIVPDLDVGAFVVTGTAGRGYVVCRRMTLAGWSAPAAVRLSGGRVGFHVGGSSADLVLLAMTAGSAERLLDKKYGLGADGTVEAGPVGRLPPALTTAQTHADILTWSWSDGLLNGVALEGTTLHQDLDENAALYGHRIANRDIVRRDTRPPESATALLAILNRYSPHDRAR